MIRNCLEALAYGILTECHKSESDKRHVEIDISFASIGLANGLRHCSVQITCKAKCGWLIDAYGGEAEELQQKASRIKKMLANVSSAEMVLDVVYGEFPGLIMQVNV